MPFNFTNFADLYGKIPKFGSSKLRRCVFFGPPDAPKDPILVFLKDIVNSKCFIEGIFLLIFGHFSNFCARISDQKVVFQAPNKGPVYWKRS